MFLMKLNQFTRLLLLQTALYTEDWIGLKTLDNAGKVKFINVTGNHLQISTSDMEEFIVPYLVDKDAVELKRELIKTEESAFQRLILRIKRLIQILTRFLEGPSMVLSIEYR